MSAWRSPGTARLRSVCLVLALLTACVAKHDAEPYARDGVRYGVTEGRFRGRWWNYYERGRSFLEGGFYNEAESDLRAALAGRNRDSLWPRTYGLHLLPEYFPIRELGIVYFHQDRLEESAAALERSLSQQHSARAAFFLGEARRKLIVAQGGDAELPTIKIIAPRGDIPIGATRARIEGVARDNTYVAAVRVGDRPVDVTVSAPEVSFSGEVALTPGQNRVPVTATDLAGNTAVAYAFVETDVDGPAVSFDTPVVVPGIVRGLAMDRSGVASLHIGGKDAAIAGRPGRPASFEVELAHVDLESPVYFACADTLGNVTQGLVPVDAATFAKRHGDMVFAADGGTAHALPPPFHARMINGRLLVLAANPRDGLRVEMPEIREGDQYYEDEIVVALAVRSDAPITQVALNEQPVAVIPGRAEMRVTRRLRLDAGPNVLHARATDAADRAADDRKTILRERSEIEVDAAKLAVAFLRAETRIENPGLTEDAVTVLDLLGAIPAVAQRFRIVDRALLEPILAEQELSGFLASPRNRLALNQLTAAEVVFTARVRRDAESIEIVLNGTSTETGEYIATFIDVAGPYAELDRVIEDLGYRLVQVFPRPTGTVWNWDAPVLEFDLNRSHRIRPSMKCVVFRTEERMHPVTGLPTGSLRPKVIGQGLILGVGAEFSTARILPESDAESVGAYPIEPGHHVVIK